MSPGGSLRSFSLRQRSSAIPAGQVGTRRALWRWCPQGDVSRHNLAGASAPHGRRPNEGVNMTTRSQAAESRPSGGLSRLTLTFGTCHEPSIER
jgi:hypothetical protein